MNFERGREPKDIMGISRVYSRNQFPGYKFRAIVELWHKARKDNYPASNETRLDVYTNETDRMEAEMELRRRIKGKKDILEVRIVHWASKEQDDLAEKFIEETLKGL